MGAGKEQHCHMGGQALGNGFDVGGQQKDHHRARGNCRRGMTQMEEAACSLLVGSK